MSRPVLTTTYRIRAVLWVLICLLFGFSLPASAVQDTITDYQYDANGNLTQIASPLDTVSNPVKTDHSYDALDRLSTIIQPSPAPGGVRPDIFLNHDGQNQLTQVNDPRGLITDYTIDGIGNTTAVTSPDSGAASATYDAAGNLKTRIDARGKTATYSYDAQNRLTRITYTTGTPTVFTYDGGPTNTVAANIGRLTAMTDEAGSTTYAYDASGRLTSTIQKLTGTQTAWFKTVNYAYGATGIAKGKVSNLTYPSGNRINYTYDAAGRIRSITLNPTNTNGVGSNTAVTTPLLTAIGYTPAGQFRSGLWGNHSAAAPSTFNHVDDLDGRVRAYSLGNTSQGGTNRSLTFDAASRITAMNHTGTGTFDPANFNQTFSYDNLGRLTAYTSANGSQSYTYDDSGNRTSTDTFTHNIDPNSNRLLNTTGPAPAKTNTYDAAGNLKSDGAISYTYSDRGRLKSAQKGAAITRYAYNGLDQRVKKIGATDASITQYVYDQQGHLLGEYDFYGRPLQETVYLGDMPIAVLTQTVNSTATGSVTVDNTAAGNATTGSWPAETAIAGFQGTNYQTHAATATTTDSFTWKANLPAAGKYWFQARWTADTTRASNATYTVTGADGVSSRVLDQRSNNNTWVNLGLKTITAANLTATVKLAASSLGTVSADAVRALPALVAATPIHYIFTDHLNTPRVITRATDNQMVWRWGQADPFGALPPNQNPSGLGTFKYNPRFPGQLYDAETGLYYNYHRHYSPPTGTYTQSDPIGLQGGINTYGYVNGNPVNAIDPLGLTQRDIDVARQIAVTTQQDLKFPDSYKVIDLGYTEDGGEIVGETLPQVGTRLDDQYLKPLNNSEAAELLNTIIHEAVHYTLDPNDKRQPDGDRSGYPYDEANRRTTEKLIKKLNTERKAKQCP